MEETSSTAGPAVALGAVRQQRGDEPTILQLLASHPHAPAVAVASLSEKTVADAALRERLSVKVSKYHRTAER